MKHFFFAIIIATVLSFGTLSPRLAAAADSTVNLKRAQVTGIEDDVVTVAYTERGRKVYDPLLITTDTGIYKNGKLASLKSVKLRQYLWIAALRVGDELYAQRIDIGGPAPKPKPKPIAKPTVKNAAVTPGK